MNCVFGGGWGFGINPGLKICLVLIVFSTTLPVMV